MTAILLDPSAKNVKNMEDTVSVRRILSVDNVTNVLQEHTDSPLTDVNHAIVTVLDQKTTNVIS